MNFLELTQALRLEAGASGEGPGSVEEARGEHARLVHFVREAEHALSMMWDDWHFLYRRYRINWFVGEQMREASALGYDEFARPLDEALARVDLTDVRFSLNADGTDARKLHHCEWVDFQRAYGDGYSASPSRPYTFTVRPDGAWILDAPSHASGFIHFGAWRSPVRMRESLNEPMCPARHHRTVLLKAKMAYAEHEDAREMLEPVAVEYAEHLQRLESDQLPNGAYRRRSQLDDLEIVVRAA